VYCTTAHLRGQLTGLCGSSSWGRQVLRGSALGGRAAAGVFLCRLCAALRPAAVEDLEQLRHLATRRAALARVALNDPGADECSSSSGGGGLGSSLHPADWSWALAQVQQVRGGGGGMLRQGSRSGRGEAAAGEVAARLGWP
jgi:hypothetical protein